MSLSLDFANTLYGRGSMPTESLYGLKDLLRWCGENASLAEAAIDQIDAWSRKDEEAAGHVFRRALEIRESVYRTFAQFACERNAPVADVENLNRAIAAAPARNFVQPAGETFGWSVPLEPASAESLLAPVLWSAGDLLTGKYLHRVRLCANHKCLWLFLDDSLSGRRRWCSMSACGNRAKTQRHYLRRKAG